MVLLLCGGGVCGVRVVSCVCLGVVVVVGLRLVGMGVVVCD